jgi:flagellar hook-length control protein FliK
MSAAISSFVPPVAPQMPQAQAPAPSSSSQPGFSQMLSQAQSREAEAPVADGAPEPAAAKPGHATQAERKAEKAGKADKSDKNTQATESEPGAEKTEGDAPAVDAGGTAEATQGAPVADPTLADWLAALQRPMTPPDTVSPKGTVAEAEAGSDVALLPKVGAARGGLGAAGAKDLKAQEAADQARETQAKAAAEPARAAAETSSFQVAMAQAGDHRELKPVQELPSMPNVAAGVQPTQGASRASETTVPVPVQVPTPATSPEFAQTLGVQVSVLAKDGIQQAELHLNPADMGPISVQIAIDGTQAQVNFGADVAATRQIIENGLPELAASLREAGFTLSGGGVHSHARGREQGDEANGERGERSGTRAIGATETDVTPRRVVSRVSAGGVDLYA